MARTATDKTLLNFRCPNDLIAAIDKLGQQRYPEINKNGCDRSKTLLDIINAGIQALTDGSIVLPIASDVRQKDVKQFDIDVEAIKAELLDKLISEIDQRINASIQPIRGELLEKLTIINTDNEALRQQINVLRSDVDVLHSQIEKLSNTANDTSGNLLDQEVVEEPAPTVEPDTLLAPLPDNSPDLNESPDTTAEPATSSGPDETVAIDEAEKTDAGESEVQTGDELVTVEEGGESAIAGDQKPANDIAPGTIITKKQLREIYPHLKPQDITDWASGKVKDGAERLAALGFEVAEEKGKGNSYLYRKLP